MQCIACGLIHKYPFRSLKGLRDKWCVAALCAALESRDKLLREQTARRLKAECDAPGERNWDGTTEEERDHWRSEVDRLGLMPPLMRPEKHKHHWERSGPCRQEGCRVFCICGKRGFKPWIGRVELDVEAEGRSVRAPAASARPARPMTLRT